MWEQQRRNPVLAAPGSKNYTGLIARTISNGGSEAYNFQALSDEKANDLCERYLPLAYKTAGKYEDRGIDLDDLQSAGLAGLVKASRRYDPQRGPFGPYAKFFINGEINALFKKKKTNKEILVEEPISELEIAPVELPKVDLEKLTPTEHRVVTGRAAGETLKEVGSDLGISAERARQIESRATEKLRTGNGNIARAC